MSGPRERRERGSELCRKLARRVAEIAPAGLRRSDDAWEHVGPASADFMAALTAWEHEGADEAEQTLRTAYVALVEAWREAADAHRAREARG